MLTRELLENKGFARIVYENQEDKPVFYSRRFEDDESVVKLHKFFGESNAEFDYDYFGLYCVVEISPDFTFAQYLFSEKEIESGYFTHARIELDEFERLLEII
ncbi:hypothetical protein [Paenibacillus vulneris]|uniref:Uncharacterized protein n=1 Tax=Paenibacillus vulneris TaxID=1133364 RepID=A0ABW3UGB6_9BACL